MPSVMHTIRSSSASAASIIASAANGGGTKIAAAFPTLSELVEDKLDVDEAYDFLFVRPFNWLARMLWKVVDVLIIDGVLNAGAFLVELTGDLADLDR